MKTALYLLSIPFWFCVHGNLASKDFMVFWLQTILETEQNQKLIPVGSLKVHTCSLKSLHSGINYTLKFAGYSKLNVCNANNSDFLVFWLPSNMSCSTQSSTLLKSNCITLNQIFNFISYYQVSCTSFILKCFFYVFVLLNLGKQSLPQIQLISVYSCCN